MADLLPWLEQHIEWVSEPMSPGKNGTALIQQLPSPISKAYLITCERVQRAYPGHRVTGASDRCCQLPPGQAGCCSRGSGLGQAHVRPRCCPGVLPLDTSLSAGLSLLQAESWPPGRGCNLASLAFISSTMPSVVQGTGHAPIQPCLLLSILLSGHGAGGVLYTC